MAGHYALLTDDTLIPKYKGISLRDGEVVGKRFSTVAYDFDAHSMTYDVGTNSLGMLGSFSSGSLTAELKLVADSASNPFRHRYHPLHDNEAYEITRQLTLTLDNPQQIRGLGDGYSQLEGRYREKVTGLYKKMIVSSGRFELQRVSEIGILNQ